MMINYELSEALKYFEPRIDYCDLSEVKQKAILEIQTVLAGKDLSYDCFGGGFSREMSRFKHLMDKAFAKIDADEIERNKPLVGLCLGCKWFFHAIDDKDYHQFGCASPYKEVKLYDESIKGKFKLRVMKICSFFLDEDLAIK